MPVSCPAAFPQASAPLSAVLPSRRHLQPGASVFWVLVMFLYVYVCKINQKNPNNCYNDVKKSLQVEISQHFM